MEFMTFLILCGVGYSVYHIYMDEKKDKAKDKMKHREEAVLLIKERLTALEGKSCELTLREPLAMIDVMYSIQGQLLDLDEEWLLITTKKGKKEQKRLIRISMVKEVTEIVA